MLYAPRKFKYKKIRKGSYPSNIHCRCKNLSFGTYGLKAQWYGNLTAKQIEACYRVLAKKIKKTGKLWVRIFPQIAVSKKPVEVRMGKGKGAVDHWIAKVRPGTLLFEVLGVGRRKAADMFKKASIKLPLATRMVYRRQIKL
jgi:large subunit ribosomal protein L16